MDLFSFTISYPRLYITQQILLDAYDFLILKVYVIVLSFLYLDEVIRTLIIKVMQNIILGRVCMTYSIEVFFFLITWTVAFL